MISLVLKCHYPFPVSSGNKLRRCILTANCPDSGTVCKTAAPGVPPDSENEEHYTITVTETSAISTFDPLTDSQYAEHGWEAGVELSDDPVAEVVMQAPDDGNEIQQAPRAKLLLQSDAPSELEVGSTLTLHGWRCEVTDAGSPAKTGLLNDDTQVPLNDAGGDSGSLTDLNEGKFFKVGKLKCKVIGKVGETKSAKKAATTTRSTLGNRPTSSYVRLPQTIARPSGTSSQMGRCVCDQNKRFVSLICVSHTSISLSFSRRNL